MVVPNSARDCDEAVTGRKWALQDQKRALGGPLHFAFGPALLWCIMSDLRSCRGVGYLGSIVFSRVCLSGAYLIVIQLAYHEHMHIMIHLVEVRVCVCVCVSVYVT